MVCPCVTDGEQSHEWSTRFLLKYIDDLWLVSVEDTWDMCMLRVSLFRRCFWVGPDRRLIDYNSNDAIDDTLYPCNYSSPVDGQVFRANMPRSPARQNHAVLYRVVGPHEYKSLRAPHAIFEFWIFPPCIAPPTLPDGSVGYVRNINSLPIFVVQRGREIERRGEREVERKQNIWQKHHAEEAPQNNSAGRFPLSTALISVEQLINITSVVSAAFLSERSAS